MIENPSVPVEHALGVYHYRQFLPGNLHTDVLDFVSAQEQRKVRHDAKPGTPFPSPIHQTAVYLNQSYGFFTNTSITKHYEEGEPSEAFEIHEDPEEFFGRVILLNLDNHARTTVTFSVARLLPPVAMDTSPNSAIVMHSRNTHKVEILGSGTRHFAFFGYSDPAYVQRFKEEHGYHPDGFPAPYFDPFD